MRIEVLNKFIDVFGDKADKKFNELNQFNKLELYKIEIKK